MGRITIIPAEKEIMEGIADTYTGNRPRENLNDESSVYNYKITCCEMSVSSIVFLE